MRLKTGQKCAFGFGAFGKDIVYMLISSYLLYYYNVVLGMSSVFIGTVMMAARIFDAFNDPVMGIIVAKTRTGWGRFRPWIFAGTVLNAVTIYALYATPEESVIFSMQTFTVKLASGVAVFLAGLVVDWIHLDTVSFATEAPSNSIPVAIKFSSIMQ